MALAFIDGYDAYANTDLGKKWTIISNANLVADKVRTGSNSLSRIGSSFYATWTDSSTTVYANAILGTAILINSLPSSVTSFANFTGNTGAIQTSLYINTEGRFILQRGGGLPGVTSGGTILATSSKVLTPNTWYYLEWRVVSNTTTGISEIRINGDNTGWIYVSSVNTQNITGAGNNRITGFSIGGPAATYYDDTYYISENGSGITTFRGDCAVRASRPDADGNQTDFTPLTGVDNYAMVDETYQDGDTTYNSSATSGDIDLYGFQATGFSSAANVHGVQVLNVVRKTDAGVCTVRPKIRSGGSNYNGSNTNPSTTYTFVYQVFENNPATAAKWTVSDVEAAEFGVERTA